MARSHQVRPKSGSAHSKAQARVTARPASNVPHVIQKNTLTPGEVRAHIKKGNSQAHGGVSPLEAVTSRNTGYQPLPKPLGLPPYHYDISEYLPKIAQQITAAGKMTIDILGDSGGVQDGEYQDSVAAYMIQQAGDQGQNRNFCYHVGDVVYFTGAHDDYYAQFYEPYQRYIPPILSIPGNHDGEVDDPTQQTSLDGWVDYFMQPTPDVDPISKDAPRVGLNLPNPYWTLVTPFATFIGMYTNVPEGGSVDSNQQMWITNEFATAPTDRALILALHHPIYSFDVYHSGSSKMADVLENAIRDTGRVPNMVLAGHVHDYQRIEQQIAPGGATPFFVIGNGGYHNLHAIHSPNGTVASDTKAKLIYGKVTWGYVTLTIDKKSITGHSIEVNKDGSTEDPADSFTYSAAPVTLANPKSVPTL
jgi:acid phosphatase type 7